MHSGNAMTPDNPSFATTVGIAALILEGRPLWECEYDLDAETSNSTSQQPHQQQPQQHSQPQLPHQPQPQMQQQQPHQQQQQHHSLNIETTPVAHTSTSPSLPNSTSATQSSGASSSSSSDSVTNNPSSSLSPSPNTHHAPAASSSSSTSSLAASNLAVPANAPFSSSASHSGNAATGGRSLPKALRDETVQHIQRLRQKLMFIRSEPGTSRDTIQQAIVVPVGGNATTGQSFGVLQMDGSDDGPDDGFACMASQSRIIQLTAQPIQSQPAPGLLSSLQALATHTCISATSRSLSRQAGLLQTVETGWTVSGFVGEKSPSSATPSEWTATIPSPAVAVAVEISPQTPPAVTVVSNAMLTTALQQVAAVAEEKAKAAKKNKMGPHCEEFLKKIGLIRSADAVAADAVAAAARLVAPTTPRSSQWQPSPKVPYVEVHHCNLRIASCNRWQHEFDKLFSLFTSTEAICIDVYLGPDHDAILLEQWTIQQCDRTNQMTMTLPSLCSAIRSQLYFSQISAWTEQLKSASPLDPLVHNNARLLPMAGGLYKLDVHYRIRAFDNTASFTAKPNVHNFPDATVNDMCCVKVSLKSLPRRNSIPTTVGGCASSTPLSPQPHPEHIRKTSLSTVAMASTSSTTSNEAASTSAAAIAANSDESGGSSGVVSRHLRQDIATAAVITASSNFGRRQQMQSQTQPSQRQLPKHQCTETGKHQCTTGAFDEERCSDEMPISSQESSSVTSPSPPSPLENPLLAHRTRQLQKYRKRLLRRDQKKKTPQQTAAAATSSSSASIPSSKTLLTSISAEPSTSMVTTTSATPERPARSNNDGQTASGISQISINSIRPPLYSAMESNTVAGPSAVAAVAPMEESTSWRHYVETKSIGTQTLLADEPQTVYPNCDLCGIEMQFVCWNCDKKLFERWSSRPASPSPLIGPLTGSVNNSGGDRLLQSIQRTPSFRQLQIARQRKEQNSNQSNIDNNMHCDQNGSSLQNQQHEQQEQQQEPIPPPHHQHLESTCDSIRNGGRNDITHCQLCKRQKTAHNYLANRCAEDRTGNINNNNSFTCSYNIDSNNLRNNNNNDSFTEIASSTSNEMPNGHHLNDNDGREKSMRLYQNGIRNATTIGITATNSSSIDAEDALDQPTSSFHRRTMSESLDSTLPDSSCLMLMADDDQVVTAGLGLLSSSTKESRLATRLHNQQQLHPTMSDAELKLYRRAFSEDVLACGFNEADARAAALFDLKPCANSDMADSPIKISVPSTFPSPSTCLPSSSFLPLTPPSSAIVFKTPTPKAPTLSVPHQLTISTSNRDLWPPLEIQCSPSSSLSAMSLDSTSPQPSRTTHHKPSSSRSATFTPPPTSIAAYVAAYGEHTRPVPKVNLNKIFSISPSSNGVEADSGDSVVPPRFTFDSVFAAGGTKPTTIGTVLERCNSLHHEQQSTTTTGNTNALLAITALECNTIEDDSCCSSSSGCITGTVHKSNSAPSFAAAAAAVTSASAQQLLSPRFLKLAAIQKRRSRHLSDRSSERSSIGSDELMSDEEFSAENAYMVMLTPNRVARGVVRKPLPKSYPFGRRALLGSIEESLLQRCFVPTFHVPGFKVLLGASGGFCPTQLTIPSSTSFYELHGQCLSTPYMCEIRMPRKGYSIPRKGTVQATLLNPHGLVVRMFVVPYDLRDMPVMHQTFMRQRVLAFDERLSTMREGTAANSCGLSTDEQMKLLRYAIHLRFQTSRSGRLALHTDIRMVISRRTDCDTAAAHAKGILEAPNELKVVVAAPESPKYSPRLDKM